MNPSVARPASNAVSPAADHPSRINRLFVGLGLVLCLYLVWPAFSAVHLEGYTAQIESTAMLMTRAPGLEHDPYLPIVSQFIYQTRSAVIDTLALIYRVFPGAGDLAFQAMVLTSFVVLMAMSVVFARRWGNLPAVFALFALVLTQGIPETAFFFNDNIVSAALACIALVLVSKTSTVWAWLLSGIVIAAAILSRVDAVFMTPMIFGAILYSFKETRKRLAACAAFSAAAAAVLAISAINHGFSLLDIFFLAGRFIPDPNYSRWLANLIWVRVLFVGILSFPFLLVGLLIALQRFKSEKSYIGALTFVGYPVLLGIFAPKATEVRYIFPLLAPMIALHVGTGLQWVSQKFSADRKSGHFRYAAGTSALVAFAALFPPTQVVMSDGPRAFLGRLWTPVFWLRWQASVDESTRRLNKLVAALDNQQKNVLISTHFNDEFYMRLRLIEAGFVPASASDDFPGCKGFSLLKKGKSIVAHIRTDPQYRIAPVTVQYNAALQISSALKCEGLKTFTKTYISTFGDNDRGMPAVVYDVSPRSFEGPLTIGFDDLRTRLSPYNLDLIRDFGLVDFRELSAAEISLLKADTERYLRYFPERDPKTGVLVTIDAYEKYYQPIAGPTSHVLTQIRHDLKALVGQ